MDLTDTRQLVERETEIAEELEELEDEVETHPSKRAGLEQDIEELHTEQHEIEDIRTSVADFGHGSEMIECDSFTDYARQYAEDVGAIESDARWPCNHIDWDKAAQELASDYTEVEYQGTSYYVR